MNIYSHHLRIFFIGLFFLFAPQAMSQQLLTEDFDYGAVAGDLVTVSGGNWASHSGTTAVGYQTSGLTLSGYPNAVTGGAATIGSNSQDVNRAFTSQSTGIVYMSALMNISSVGGGTYFLHFNSTGTFAGRVFAKSATGGFNFGLSSSTSTGAYDSTVFSLGTTYAVVVKYNIDSGDSALFVIDTSFPATEPGTPLITSTGSGASVSAVALRQGSGGPTAVIDGVRVGTTWRDPLPGAVIMSCNGPATTDEGVALSHDVDATDSNGVVVDIAITSITPTPTAGTITLSNLVPGQNPGDTATAKVDISDSVPSGLYQVELTATNNDSSPETGTCMLSVQIAATATIAEIQGSPLSQGPNYASPYEGMSVKTTGIVTAVFSNQFFIQMPEPGDGDNTTSDGMLVYTGGAPGVAVGDDVTVSGDVVEYYGMTEFPNSAVVVVNSSGHAIPSAVVLDPGFPLFSQPNDLEQVEGMLVSVTNGTVITPGATGPGGANFYAVANDVPRALRETGILTPGLPLLPIFDANPEVFRVNMNLPAGTPPPGTYPVAGTTFSASGPLLYSFGEYRLETLNNNLTFGAQPSATPIRDAESGEFVVASINTEYLDSTNPGKIQKAAKAIVNVLKSPDLIALQEVVDQASLDALIAQIQVEDPGSVYTGIVAPDSDGFDQEVAFMYRNTVTVNSLSEFGAGLTYLNSASGCAENNLHDRLPYTLEATITPAGGVAFDLTLVNVHLKALSGIDDAVQGERTRMKRWMAAMSLAEHVQSLRDANPNRNLVVLGDFNAYQFTDGYVDVAGIIQGNPDFDLLESNTFADIVEPDLINLTDWVPLDQSYSFVFGNAGQILDQMLISPTFSCQVTGYDIAHVNADYPEVEFETNVTRPERYTDHDHPVMFVQTLNNEMPIISISDSSIIEGDAGSNFMEFVVTLCSTSSEAVAVGWSPKSRSAESGIDFSAADGIVVFNVGETQKTLSVEVFGDTDVEGQERFSVVLDNPVNGWLGDKEGVGIIADDDSAPALEVTAVLSTVRLEGNVALKVWPTMGTGEGTYSVLWEDMSITPQYVFAADENPAIIAPPAGAPELYKYTVVDLLGSTAQGFMVVGVNLLDMLESWTSPTNDINGDGINNILDDVLVASTPEHTQYVYPCDIP